MMPDQELANQAAQHSQTGLWGFLISAMGVLGVSLGRGKTVRRLVKDVSTLKDSTISLTEFAEFQTKFFERMDRSEERIFSRMDEKFDGISTRLDRHIDGHPSRGL